MKTRKPVAAGTYLRGAGLALKAGQNHEAAEFFLKGGEFETAALLFEKLGKHDRAAAAYEKADQPLEAAASWSAAGELLRAAELYADAGRTEEAARACRRAGAFDRAAALFADGGRWLEAAKMASEANDAKAMIGYLQKVPPEHADYREAVLVLARELTRRGWSTLAIDALEAALGDEPVRADNLELWYALARAHEEHGEPGAASEIVQRILTCRFDYREADSWQRRLKEQIRENERPHESFEGERYAVGDLLGRGGMGAVYRATDRLLERDVAYKVLPEAMASAPEARERLLAEARAAARLNHPNIVTVHDVGFSAGRAYIAMELVDGESYASLVKREGPLELSDVMHFLASVCQGLDHAHDKGVIHRDIKPSNILLTSEDRVKIVDFGLARHRARDGGRVAGTLKYIAPEQARGEETDPRTDIYSLGATLFELIVGRAPFTTGDLVRHHLESPPPRLTADRPDVPAPLEALVIRCLAKEPADRFESARELTAFAQSAELLAPRFA